MFWRIYENKTHIKIKQFWKSRIRAAGGYIWVINDYKFLSSWNWIYICGELLNNIPNEYCFRSFNGVTLIWNGRPRCVNFHNILCPLMMEANLYNGWYVPNGIIFSVLLNNWTRPEDLTVGHAFTVVWRIIMCRLIMRYAL